MPNWSSLSMGQKTFYMEFHAPIINDNTVVPHNNEFIPPLRCTPSALHINAVTDTGDQLVRTLNNALSESQRLAVLEWIEEQEISGIQPLRRPRLRTIVK